MSLAREQPRHVHLRLRMPRTAWPLVRAASVAGFAALVVLLVVRPALGLTLLWGVLVPLLPLVFLVAPGLWRAVCPMAAANQLPPLLGLTRGRPPPAWLRRHGYVGALGLFLALVVARELGLDDDGPLVAALLGALLLAATVSGALFAGKSGWCGGLCPLRPVQGLYAQGPLTVAGSSACRPCVGCADNCPDLKPRTALRDELLSRERWRGRQRALLAGALPGLVVAFHVSPAPAPAPSALLSLATACLVGLGVLVLVETLTSLSLDRIVALFAVASFNLFAWFNVPVLLGSIETLAGQPLPTALIWLGRENLLLLSLVWLVRAWRRDAREQPAALAPRPSAAAPAPAREHPGPERRSAARAMRMVAVALQPEGTTTSVRPGTTLAEAAEALGVRVPGGCGMGACGGDPVFVVEGAERLSPADATEQATLGRLGLEGRARLACSTRVLGDVVVALTPSGGAVRRLEGAAARHRRERVVVVGGGVAGVTAAERARSLAPDARVALVGAEPGALYNRMALLDLLRGPVDLDRLALRPAGWAADAAIDARLGTAAVRLDRRRRELLLATGETLGYDRLVLATGSRARVPDVEGFGLPGTTVLRSAADALALARACGGRAGGAATVLGGGPLGIETAAALRALGMAVTLVAAGAGLMGRHLDAVAARLLAERLEELGIELRTAAQVVGADGGQRLERARYADGTSRRADLLVACVGVVPDTQLATDAGLLVRRGIVVDGAMRTSDPRIWAAGDVVEHDGGADGLWTTAERQARAAAAGATGGEERCAPGPSVLRLKVPELELVVLGRPGEEGGEPLVLRDAAAGTYVRLGLTDGRLASAIAWGTRGLDRALHRAAELGVDLREHRAAVAAGDWAFLDEAA